MHVQGRWDREQVEGTREESKLKEGCRDEKIEVLEESRVRASLSRWLPPLDIAPHLQCSAAQEKFHHASQIFPVTHFLPLPETFSSHLPCVCYSSGVVVKKSGKNAWNSPLFSPFRQPPNTIGPPTHWSLYCSA